MKKLIVTLLLVFVLAFSLAACGGSGSSPSRDDSGSAGVENGSPETVASDAPTVEEQVLFDQDGILITLKGLTIDGVLSFGPSLQLLIENNGSTDVLVQTRDASINGIMVDSNMSADVVAGKMANTDLTFFSSYLDKANIEQIKDIEFKFMVADASTWDEIAKSDAIIVRTSVDDSYVQTYDDSGSAIYDENGIKVIAKKLDSTDSFWGADVYLYIENNSDQDVLVQTRDCSVNGFMIEPMFSAEILKGKKAFSEMTFLESDLESNGIESINTLEFSILVANKDTWEDIAKSGVITVNIN